MTISRRYFMRTAAATFAGFSGLHQLVTYAYSEAPSAEAATEGFGPLNLDPDEILDLPPGFTYRVVSRVGDSMVNGLLVPGAQDGMAAFPGPQGKTILVCNHELTTGSNRGPFGEGNELLSRLDPAMLYDSGGGEDPCHGGTTTMVYDPETGMVERQWLSLAGTVRNCAGGLTPWNSWITCEETTQKAEDSFEQDHGYNFEVPATLHPPSVPPQPLKSMGRFNHEAVSVDPASGIVYQTEDRGDGLIYRFVPVKPGHLTEGGRLQALVVRERKQLDTRNWTERLVSPNVSMEVEWIDVENVESPEDDLRIQGFSNGAARFSRGEGMWYGRGAVYFVCTDGGSARKGQVWRYIPSPHEGRPEEESSPGSLDLFIEPNDGNLIDNADNLTVSPWGDLICCEDGPDTQYMAGVTPEGRIYKLARNGMNQSEFAGATFSADGSTLFVNIQNPGLTLAISGPWPGVRG